MRAVVAIACGLVLAFVGFGVGVAIGNDGEAASLNDGALGFVLGAAIGVGLATRLWNAAHGEELPADPETTESHPRIRW